MSYDRQVCIITRRGWRAGESDDGALSVFFGKVLLLLGTNKVVKTGGALKRILNVFI